MDSVVKQGMRIQFNEEALRFAFQRENGVLWKWDESYRPTWNVKVEKFIFLMPDGFPTKPFIPGWEMGF